MGKPCELSRTVRLIAPTGDVDAYIHALRHRPWGVRHEQTEIPAKPRTSTPQSHAQRRGASGKLSLSQVSAEPCRRTEATTARNEKAPRKVAVLILPRISRSPARSNRDSLLLLLLTAGYYANCRISSDISHQAATTKLKRYYITRIRHDSPEENARRA